MLVDTHAHVNFAAFKEEYKDVLIRAVEAGVLVVNVGTQLDTSREAVRIAEESQMSGMRGQVFAVVGLHPVHTYSQDLDEEETHFKTREEVFNYEEYKKLGENPLVVGIGECGLDYYRLSEGTDHLSIIKQQKAAFELQIKLAKELNKALVIHCRPSKNTQDAYEDILNILDFAGTSDLRFEIHSFTGSPEIAQEFVRRGAFVGFNGIITFDKTGNMAKVADTVPLERIVLETDCPYLTPVPHRGKKNEPLFVKHVAEKLAELKGASLAKVEEITTQNAKELFNLN